MYGFGSTASGAIGEARRSFPQFTPPVENPIQSFGNLSALQHSLTRALDPGGPSAVSLLPTQAPPLPGGAPAPGPGPGPAPGPGQGGAPGQGGGPPAPQQPGGGGAFGGASVGGVTVPQSLVDFSQGRGSFVPEGNPNPYTPFQSGGLGTYVQGPTSANNNGAPWIGGPGYNPGINYNLPSLNDVALSVENAVHSGMIPAGYTDAIVAQLMQGNPNRDNGAYYANANPSSYGGSLYYNQPMAGYSNQPVPGFQSAFNPQAANTASAGPGAVGAPAGAMRQAGAIIRSGPPAYGPGTPGYGTVTTGVGSTAGSLSNQAGAPITTFNAGPPSGTPGTTNFLGGTPTLQTAANGFMYYA